MPFLLLMLEAMSSSETLLNDLAHTYNPLLFFRTIPVLAMLMFSEPDELEDQLIGSSESTIVE